MMNGFNLFLANVPILYPPNTKNFLVFLGGIKWEHWPEMAKLIKKRLTEVRNFLQNL